MLMLASDVDTFRRGGSTYAIVASRTKGLQLIDISDPSSPVPIGDTGASSEPVSAVETFQRGDSTFAIAMSWQSSNGLSSLLLMDVSDPSRPVVVGNATDGIEGFALSSSGDFTTFQHVC